MWIQNRDQWHNKKYAAEAGTLFAKMLKLGAIPSKIFEITTQIRNAANGNEDAIIYGVRRLHKELEIHARQNPQ